MFCNNCGKEISEASSICPFCHNKAVHAIEESGSIGALAVLSFFIPLAGFILYLDWGSNNPQKAGRAGTWALIGLLFYITVAITGLYYNDSFAGYFTMLWDNYTEDRYNPAETHFANGDKPDPSIQKESVDLTREFYISQMKNDIDTFAKNIFRNYKLVIAQSEGKKAKISINGLKYSDREFMSKEWVAECLDFRIFDMTKVNNNGEYRMVSVSNNVIIIKGLSTVFKDTYRVMIKATINVKTEEVTVVQTKETKF